MLPAPHRLRQFRDFQRAYRSGRGVQGSLVRLKIAPNQLEHSRFGVVVPNKLIKKATQRNRKKRQMRAALHALLPRIQPGFDVVVSAQGGLAQAEYDEILADLSATLTKANIL
jgi:ribonuclease P protein component